jgi:hypothetical protein
MDIQFLGGVVSSLGAEKKQSHFWLCFEWRVGTKNPFLNGPNLRLGFLNLQRLHPQRLPATPFFLPCKSSCLLIDKIPGKKMHEHPRSSLAGTVVLIVGFLFSCKPSLLD